MRARVALLAIALLAACAPEAPFGEIEAALAGVPDGAACLRLLVVGATRSVDDRIAVDASLPAVALIGLPTGPVVLRADAYTVACGALTPATPRTWFAPPVELVLEPGRAAAVTITLYH
jgi:hypothetical protein